MTLKLKQQWIGDPGIYDLIGFSRVDVIWTLISDTHDVTNDLFVPGNPINTRIILNRNCLLKWWGKRPLQRFSMKIKHRKYVWKFLNVHIAKVSLNEIPSSSASYAVVNFGEGGLGAVNMKRKMAVSLGSPEAHVYKWQHCFHEVAFCFLNGSEVLCCLEEKKL